MAGRRLDPGKVEAMRADRRAGLSIAEISRRHGSDRGLVRKYTDAVRPGAVPQNAEPAPRLPEPAPEAGGPCLPEPVPQSYESFAVTEPGWYGVLSDAQMPYHDCTTLRLFFDECDRRDVAGVLFNGDMMDCAELSVHGRDRDLTLFRDDLAVGRQFFAYARARRRRSRLIYKFGNHEERLESYIYRNAPALAELPGLDLASLLGLAGAGVEAVADRRVVTLGKLNIVHGHEYPGGAASPVNPARGLYLKARSVALCGHHHRTSEHHARDIRGRSEAAWSVGCACFLHPRWFRLNDWNHGFAFVRVEEAGEFAVENRRVIGGKVV